MKNISSVIVIAFCMLPSCSFGPDKPYKGYTGNTVYKFEQAGLSEVYTDPVDDTTNFTRVDDKIFTDGEGKVYILSYALDSRNDTSGYFQFYKNISDFIDLATYKPIKSSYFSTKNKVYIWWANNEGYYPVEIKGANAQSFVPFDNVCGGVDETGVFYGNPTKGVITKIEGANPREIKVRNPRRGCWNCDNCYFIDDKSVYFGFSKIEEADASSFRVINEDSIDAKDDNHSYFDGKIILKGR